MDDGQLGGAVVAENEFNEPRWRRVGATDTQIANLRDKFNELDNDGRIAENKYLASRPDGELAPLLPAMSVAKTPPQQAPQS